MAPPSVHRGERGPSVSTQTGTWSLRQYTEGTWSLRQYTEGDVAPPSVHRRDPSVSTQRGTWPLRQYTSKGSTQIKASTQTQAVH